MLKKPHSLLKQASCLESVVEIIDKYGLCNILKTVVISQEILTYYKVRKSGFP
jgi:hypothetical protein